MKKNKQNYFNRELSWLAFNQRVLNLALKDSTPLLERIKFLAITDSNLDEFFMVRVGGLKMVVQLGEDRIDHMGWTPEQQLRKIRQGVLKMNQAQSECLSELEPQLKSHGIERVSAEQLSEAEHQHLENRFREEFESTMAPLAIADKEDFPMLSGVRLCVCVRLKNRAESKLGPAGANPPMTVEQVADQKADRFVLIPLGRSLSRIVTVPGESGYRYMLLEDVIGMFLPLLFNRQEILEWTSLRITRNGDVVLNEDERDDLLSGMQEMLEARQTSDCVRLEVSATASETMKSFLLECVDAEEDDVYPIDGPIGLTDFFEIATLPGFRDLKDEPWPPQPSPDFSPDQNIFETIAQGDRLLYHPYQSYDPVVRFVQTAATDPNVIAIKQTLYRTGTKSEIVAALKTAAENGKHVTAIVELKARFDEARNIYWAQHLERAGIDVIYGVRGLKTHAKICIVVRREPAGIRRYMHFGTGNYNESTARLYSDASLFSCDEQLGADAVHFFNAITGLSVPQTLQKLAAAPINLRETMLELINFETENAQRKGGGAIMAKVNSLVDIEIIDALYKASQAGVNIRLNVRGICCLVPGKKGLSENIRVVSVVDRFLEHARIFHFQHGGDQRLFISSADWMGRNLDRRVELMTPVQEESCRSGLTRILESYFEDNVSALELHPDGNTSRFRARKRNPNSESKNTCFVKPAGFMKRIPIPKRPFSAASK
jgi:polyphosphate kinase